MSVTEQTWVTAAQYRSIQAGLRVVGAWADAGREPEAALDQALRREPDPADVVVGLAIQHLPLSRVKRRRQPEPTPSAPPRLSRCPGRLGAREPCIRYDAPPVNH